MHNPSGHLLTFCLPYNYSVVNYSVFDASIDRYNVYKVETIGDAYMVASGLPTVYERHAQEMSLLSLELQDSVKHHVVEHMPHQKLQLRIGLHTGTSISTIEATLHPMCYVCFSVHKAKLLLLDPEGGSQKATLVVLLRVVRISSPGYKNPQGFLNTQLSATKLFVHIRADIAHRSTVSDFSFMF